MNIKILFVPLLMAMFTGGYAQTIDKAKLDLLFDRLLEKNKGMGSITLAKDGKVLYTRSFGYAQITETVKKPLTEATKYRIASITKTYTAAMIFQLVEEGKLKLTDHLDQFFPQIPNAGKITVAQILNHRSGIPDLPADGTFRMQPRTHEEVIAAIAKGEPLFEPDSRHLYSNTGYVLLGYILEKVGGKPYQEALQQRIISKIGLKNTYMGVGNTNPEHNESLSYRYLGAWKEAPEMDFSIPGGAGAIVSTPTDMARFIQALFDLKLVSKNSLDMMKTMRDGEGMGMEPFSFAGRTLYGHTGGSNVSGSWLAYEPTEKLAMAYTTNAKIYPVADIIAAVFDIYWNKPYEIPTFNALEVSPELLDQYVGVYVVPGTPAKMTVIRTGSTISIENGGNRIPLEATAPDKFKLAPGLTVEFDAAKKQMTIKRPQGERVFTKEN
ncbi:MAG TPA: serine hydrolase domain-containing protein [Mucilaginibacter sp.]|nr:serine hydrolase domain-containing protein [Mucilaginibacter sp.]